MKPNSMHQQIVVRISDKLNRKVEKVAKEKGLTKASWVRQLIIETIENQEKSA